MNYPKEITKMNNYSKWFTLCLDFMVDESKLSCFDFDSLLDVDDYAFPFDVKKLYKYGFPLEDVKQYIIHRKNKMLAESGTVDDDDIDDLLKEIDEVENGKDE